MLVCSVLLTVGLKQVQANHRSRHTQLLRTSQRTASEAQRIVQHFLLLGSTRPQLLRSTTTVANTTSAVGIGEISARVFLPFWGSFPKN